MKPNKYQEALHCLKRDYDAMENSRKNNPFTDIVSWEIGGGYIRLFGDNISTLQELVDRATRIEVFEEVVPCLCPLCGYILNTDEWRFCPHCGQALEWRISDE